MPFRRLIVFLIGCTCLYLAVSCVPFIEIIAHGLPLVFFSGVRSGARFLAVIVRSNCELDGILLPSFGAYHNMILLFSDSSCFPRAEESWEGKKQKRSAGSPAHCTYGVLSPSSFFMYI